MKSKIFEMALNLDNADDVKDINCNDLGVEITCCWLIVNQVTCINRYKSGKLKLVDYGGFQ